MNKWITDLNGKFNARVRESKIVTRSSKSRDGEISLSNIQAILEVKFNLEVLDRLHNPAFVAIERKSSNGVRFLVYEVIVPNPTHYQMLGMDVSMPSILREEYLDIIDDSWEKSDETWIDIITIPTNYELIISDEIEFKKCNLTPLVGAKAYLLTDHAVEKFLCIDNGVSIGDLLGFNVPLKVDIENMVRYHTGIFGFTGVGKSNLTSLLIRKSLEYIKDLHVIIFDVSGEYMIHLLDLIESASLYTTEEFNDYESLLLSQTIPETLEDKIDASSIFKKIFGRITRLTLTEYGINLNDIIAMLKNEYEGKKSVQIKITLQELDMLNIDGLSDIRGLDKESKDRLYNILNKLFDELHEKSGLRNQLTSIFRYINEGGKKEEKISPEQLAYNMNFNASRLSIVYVPEPNEARETISRFITSLLRLRKMRGSREKVLIVIDEAQEFIPDRNSEKDYSEQSNLAVEALLRQGRKYRVHCWLSTQRLAHLNVNALQQLHSYFISTMPRSYDRFVIADAFSLSYDILDKSIELSSGEWLFISYKATKQKNVPAFVKTYNNEDILSSNLSKT
ncbi:MAG: ATP-binding protein [Candidatus Nitrosocaldaceae archaeon]